MQNININRKQHLQIASHVTEAKSYFIALWFILLFGQHLFAQKPNYDSIHKKRPKVGLVLSGGGAKGFAHIGALKIIQELGIEFDYISGTSMGSVVGGLYAIGYNAEEIELMVRQQNWDKVLLDKIDRRDLSLEEKSYNEQQFFSFPVNKDNISLPFGMKYGQNISLLLSHYTSPIHQIHKFKNFQTPFLCIGTDIANGKSIILNEGNLAEAMRASMSIPTIFTPFTHDGELLVDGGLVNNFPAKELAERGCDIIIGIDVQTHKDYQVKDFSSITSVLDRSASFFRKALNDTALKYVDYYIHPDISAYGVGSFTDYDSIIVKGEEAVLAQYKELEKLADYLKSFLDYQVKIRDLSPLKSFVFDSLLIEGNHEVSTQSISSVFPFEKGDIVEITELENIVKKLYGSLFFNTVRYSFQSGKNGVIIVIKVEETSFGTIGIGAHYDTEYKAGLLLSGKFRNVFIKNTLLLTKVGLSENPHLSFDYYQNKGLLPSFGFSSSWSSFSFNDYKGGKTKVGEYRFNNLLYNLYVQSMSKKVFAIGAGAQVAISSLHNDIGIDFGVDNSSFSQTTLNLYGFFKLDRFDNSFFPHKGGKAEITGVYVTKLLLGGNANSGTTTSILSSYYDKAIPLWPRWTLRPRINLGLTFGGGVYFGQMFLLGGQGSHYLPGMVSFSGLNVAQKTGTQMAAARIRLQYRLLKNHYIMATIDAGNVTDSREDLIYIDHAAMGYGVTYGYDSLLGPIELSIMGSNYKGISAFLNIGFWF
ncbi:MAG: hypothetical protein B7C24_00115 [Bacteroidetes bacterium 4572_77]|nr:MAG: hypothetical protein B7C24_00115 [Bacteroidetes bacterium 4572_77]